MTCKTGESVAGVLFSHDSKALVLRDAEALGAGERNTNVPVDGEWIALFDNVSFIQRP